MYGERDFEAKLPLAKRSLPYQDQEMDKTNPAKRHKADITPGMAMNEQKTILKKDFISLAERMRPECLSDYVGQEQIIGCDTVLNKLLTNGHVPSMVLWGPPGCGKTSLANVISVLSKTVHGKEVHIIKLSAISCGINKIRDIVSTSKTVLKKKCQTIVFMDEIHRFNKLQQDIFLPHVEAGTFTLIGTTTENPYYSLNSALLSRCRVFVLNKLSVSNIVQILCKAIASINGEISNTQQKVLLTNKEDKVNFKCKPDFCISKTVINWLAEVSDGDARVALNGLDLAIKSKRSDDLKSITLEDVKESLVQVHTLSDKQSNNIHHLYSALHKSITAGEENASVYWLARIIAIKEDPVNIARRLIRISSEDIGLADLDALGIAVHTMHGCQMIGFPESDVLLTECVVYLTRAPKSRLVYNALKSVENVILNHKGPQPTVPLHIRDRSARKKLSAVFAGREEHLSRREETVKTYLPLGLQHLDFFLDSKPGLL